MSFATACGKHICIPPATRHHLRAHPGIIELLPEACRRVILPINETMLAIEVDLGQIVGRSGRVETSLIDVHTVTSFAYRIGRRKPSRVIAGRSGEECSTVVIIAGPTEHAYKYRLHTAYVGTLAKPEPFERSLNALEREQAIDFWCRNALTHDTHTMGKPFFRTWSQILG